ncbi:MAG: tyrosine-type recombinase/integrase, partial [Streptosporangiaceae bacterium]
RELEESTIAGVAYGSGVAELDWYQGGEYVITDQAGTPVHPEWYSGEFRRLLRRAGLRKITLHDSRHTTLTLMEHAGVPISIISKWAGHYDSAFTQKPTSMRARKTCNGGRPRSPGSIRSLRAVRNCETPGPTAGTQLASYCGK